MTPDELCEFALDRRAADSGPAVAQEIGAESARRHTTASKGEDHPGRNGR
jgi:hypothetical protein